ncbi:hypothetical protein MUCCIDRAFT_182376 [Mucor lusitanicus CBS 277.49]|uniref:Uncharacterized protein n=2 Tax=Mucor circinelloides f. lusitanicus TaxID=29924 RepID=A0A162R4C7_MUCCL|nr:hypothetical protein MUCCIDRAFT_182376 [Mucor lusitanicus CBS 277.49]
MSLNRQRPRTRVNSRANTLPSLSNITVNTDTTSTSATTMDTSNSAFLPSIEESLQDWLSRSIPDTPSSSVSWLLDTCRCCNQNDCENLETITSTIRKLENDARLAAVIGQSLLQKHEQFVAESNDMKQQLEQQVDLLQDKMRELEQSLIESDTCKQEYLQDKNKSTWECQKLQKALDETTSDLDICNNRCLQLGSELKQRNNEVEKLRIFKFMARQADIREDTLRAKLEDVKQELAVSRKAELTLESKHKKLRTKYESMCFSYEKLKLDQQEMGITSNHQLDLVWLRESNEKLRKDVLKLTSALLSPTASDLQMTNHNQLIELIKELASANNKLKSDLLDCSDLLMECRSDLYAKQDAHMQHDDGSYNDENCDRLSTSAPQKSSTILDALPRLPRHPQKDETGTASVPQEASAPIVHHHYHYYMRNKLLAEKGKNKTAAATATTKLKSGQTTPKVSLSSSSLSKIDTSSPFKQLYSQVFNALQRLQQTDIRALNRRLRRAFDILELSSMSNSIIENIVTDVDGFRTRFLWIEDASLVKQETWIHDVSMLEFFPIIGLVQEMLKEIGQLRTTMNDLQVEYVKKVEESDIRLEEEVLRKQQQQQQQRQQITDKEQSKTSSALAWLSNVFQRSPTPTSKERKGVQPMASHGSLHARFMASNISDVSVHSTSIHPLSKPKTIPCPSNSNTAAAAERPSNKIAIRRQKSDIDRYGPPSSFPTRSPAVAIGNEKSKRRSTSTAIAVPSSVSFSSSPSSNNLHLHSSTSSTGSNSTKVTIPLRASQSAGTVRKSQSMQAPALEYVVRRKRSTLGLSSSSSNDYDLPQSTSSEMTGAFTTTSWLGNK